MQCQQLIGRKHILTSLIHITLNSKTLNPKLKLKPVQAFTGCHKENLTYNSVQKMSPAANLEHFKLGIWEFNGWTQVWNNFCNIFCVSF